MKRCPQCDTEKQLDQFGKNASRQDGLHTECKACRSAYQKQWYAKNKALHGRRVKKNKDTSRQILREFIWNYLDSHPCTICGESDPIVLEFDHIDRSTKLFDIGAGVGQGISRARLVDEIAKCQVLCANCHRRRTAVQCGWHIVARQGT